jgi:hypothetical protein
MTMPIVVLPDADSAKRSRLLSVHYLRQRALDRLYARRDAVDDLIKSLEVYSKTQDEPSGDCVEFNSERKCS